MVRVICAASALVVLALATGGAAYAQNPTPPEKGQNQEKKEDLSEQWWDPKKLSFAIPATLGAFVLYMLYRHQNRQPFSLFLALNIKVDNTAHYGIILLDMIISSIIGGVSVTLLTAPVTVSQAFAAGLGMTGIFSAHLRQIDPPNPNPPPVTGT